MTRGTQERSDPSSALESRAMDGLDILDRTERTPTGGLRLASPPHRVTRLVTRPAGRPVRASRRWWRAARTTSPWRRCVVRVLVGCDVVALLCVVVAWGAKASPLTVAPLVLVILAVVGALGAYRPRLSPAAAVSSDELVLVPHGTDDEPWGPVVVEVDGSRATKRELRETAAVLRGLDLDLVAATVAAR